MNAIHIAVTIGAVGGVLLGALIAAAVAVLMHCKAIERIERRTLTYGFYLGRRDEREAFERELASLAWKSETVLPHPPLPRKPIAAR